MGCRTRRCSESRGRSKTFTIANVIEPCSGRRWCSRTTRPWRRNCTGSSRSSFRATRSKIFVSYYDYYQPEAYVPSSDHSIEKDTSINEHIEQMRLSATKSAAGASGLDHRGHGFCDLRPGRSGGVSQWSRFHSQAHRISANFRRLRHAVQAQRDGSHRRPEQSSARDVIDISSGD